MPEVDEQWPPDPCGFCLFMDVAGKDIVAQLKCSACHRMDHYVDYSVLYVWEEMSL